MKLLMKPDSLNEHGRRPKDLYTGAMAVIRLRGSDDDDDDDDDDGVGEHVKVFERHTGQCPNDLCTYPLEGPMDPVAMREHAGLLRDIKANLSENLPLKRMTTMKALRDVLLERNKVWKLSDHDCIEWLDNMEARLRRMCEDEKKDEKVENQYSIRWDATYGKYTFDCEHLITNHWLTVKMSPGHRLLCSLYEQSRQILYVNVASFGDADSEAALQASYDFMVSICIEYCKNLLRSADLRSRRDFLLRHRNSELNAAPEVRNRRVATTVAAEPAQELTPKVKKQKIMKQKIKPAANPRQPTGFEP